MSLAAQTLSLPKLSDLAHLQHPWRQVHSRFVVSYPAQRKLRGRCQAVAALPDQLANRIDNPVVRQAFREPVAFWGGVFAGVFSLTLTEEPLRSWIERTSAEAGISYQVALSRLEQQRASSS